VAESYSAGTIFLQVVPVFRHTQDKVTAYAKGISKAMGEELDKGGQDAGDKFNEGFEKEVKKGAKQAAETHATEFQRQYDRAVTSMQKNLKAIEPRLENKEARRQIRELREDLDRLPDSKEIRTKAQVKEAIADIRILEAQIGGLPEVVSTRAKFEATQAYKDAAKFVAFVESIDGKDIELQVKIDDKDAVRSLRNVERQMGAFEKAIRNRAQKAADALGDPISKRAKEIKAELLGLARTDIHIGLNDDIAHERIMKLMAELKELSMQSPTIGADTDFGKAFLELFALKREVKSLDGKTINIRADADTAGARAGLLGLGNDSRGAANAFRAFNIIILAAIAILPALIPILAALGGALLALGPILAGLGGGLAAVAIGFSGIANAVQALNARSQQATKDTLTQTAQIKAAWYSVLDARQAVNDAERTYARTAADAARQVADARRAASEATRTALEQQRQAQQSYADSVDNVRQAEQNLADARKQAKQDQQSLKDQIKDTKLGIRQGVLNAFDATNNLNAVMADGSSTNYDKEQAKIQRAQALQSLHEQREQLKQLQQQQRKNRREGINGSDAVKTAQDQLTAAIQAQQDAEIALRDADRNVTRTRVDNARRIKDALRNQHQADADGRRSVARAQEQLRRAQESYNAALKKTNDYGSAAENNVKQAMAVLGPAGRQFARFIFSLRKGFYQLRNDIQSVMLPPIERAIKRVVKVLGPRVHDLLVGMAKGFGKFVTQLSKSLTGKVWGNFFDMLDRFGPKFGRQFGKGVVLWLKIFARLFTLTAPFALQLSKGLLGIAKAVNRWMNSKRGTKVIQDFMEYAFKVGPQVVDFLKDLIRAAINLAKALAPWGGAVLKILDKFLEWIASMDPRTLGVLAQSIILLIGSIQLSLGLIAGISAATTLLLNPWGLLALAIALVIGAIVVLASRFKTVRTVLGVLWGVLKKFIKVWWFFQTLGLRIIWMLGKYLAHNELVRKVVTAAWKAISKAFDVAKTAITKAIHAIGDALQWVWENILKPVIDVFGKAISWLWKHAVRPALVAIWGLMQKLGSIIKHVWKGFIWPVLDLMIHIWTKLATKVWIPLIKQVFKAFTHMGDIIHAVWVHVLKPVFDAFGKAANWLWDKTLHPVFKAIGWVWAQEMKGLRKIYDTWVKPMVDAFINLMGGPEGLKSKFKAVVEALGNIWAGLKKLFAAPIKFVVDTVINDGIIAGFNKVAHFVGSAEMDTIKLPKSIENAYARGGVMPGYFPGGDNHHFTSPTGGRLHLSGGEAIMRPEFTQAVGSGFINAMNQAAANQGPRGVKRLLNASAGHFFSEGGIFGGTRFAKGGFLKDPDEKVYMDGKPIAAIAAAQVLLAEKLKQTNYYLMQGGFGGDHIAASGTSHNYPGVADISTPTGVTFADQKMLRKVGFAAWARNIPGADYVGSGEHVHSASLLSPGTASSPQIYSSWPGHTDGLNGGPDYGPRPAMLPNLTALLSGFDLSNIDAGGSGHHGFGLPGWLLDIARNPIGYVGGLVTKPIHALYDKFGDSDFVHGIAGMPMHLIKGVAHKVLDLIPGGKQIAAAAGFAWDKVTDAGHFIGSGVSHLADGIGNVGDVLGFSSGGVLPYNGTMMYDAGGYLPPGLTSVVNLTGKPEPVFTHDQFQGMSDGKGGWTYAPTFYEAHDPTEVIDDLEFTMRKLGRGTGRGPAGGNR
jgi:hypothetical protein